MHVARIPGLNSKGPHVALVNGLVASTVTWMTLVKAMLGTAKDFLVFDLPSHGLSPNPMGQFTCYDAYKCVKTCLLKNLDPDDNNLIIGNSLGGAFTVRFACECPDYANKNVLISPAGAPFPTSAHDVVDLFNVSDLKGVKKIIDRIWVHPKTTTYTLAPFMLHTLKSRGFHSLLKSITDIDDDPQSPTKELIFTPQMLQNIPNPTLLIWGKEDHVLPHKMCEFFDTHLPAQATRIFPDTFGHSPQLEEPEKLAEIIDDWLRQFE
ncbi:MAG: alpha/beta hydrolase [Proteobacteria bacterium]|nr:alpha/beta hydrolase [Pseudomonadota bacterium]